MLLQLRLLQQGKPAAEAKAKPAAKAKLAADAKPATKVKPAAESKPVVDPKPEAAAKPAVESNPVATTTQLSVEAKVSQRQPSQLKSSARSLANKDSADKTNGASFASKKDVDVNAPDTPIAA